MELLFKNYIERELILDLDKDDKTEILKKVSKELCEHGGIIAEALFTEEILKRETQLSTGIGLGIAVPHARIDNIDDFKIAIARIKQGIPFDSIDDKPVKVIIMIASPKKRQNDYIKLLAQIVLFAKNKSNFNSLVSLPPGELELYIKGRK